MKEFKIRITLTEEMLGMSPTDPEIFDNFIASNAPDAPTREEEIEIMGLQAVQEKGKTVFPKMEDGTPHLWDYQLKGFFKDAVGMLRRVPGTACSKVKAFKKEIDGLLFIEERIVPINCAGPIGCCQRPLRTDGPSGSMTALASGETVPAGSSFEFTLTLMRDDMENWVRECLDYGKRRGMCQWRNSGKGRFTWEDISA